MKKALIAAAMMAVSVGALAQAQPKQVAPSAVGKPGKTNAKAGNEKPSAPAPTKAEELTGPVGLGDIKLGMTLQGIQDAIAANADASVRLVGVPTLKPPSTTSPPPPGVERYEVDVNMSGLPAALPLTLKFKDGALHGINAQFKGDNELIFEKVKAQIGAKYGAPAIEDTRKEEDCIYRNGNSFKLKSGYVQEYWVAKPKGMEPIRTDATDLHVQMCPAKLTDGLFGIKIKSINIEFAAAKPEVQPPAKGVF